MIKQLTHKLEATACSNIEILNTVKYKLKISNECSLSMKLVEELVIISTYFCYSLCIGEDFVCPDVSLDLRVTPSKQRHGRLRLYNGLKMVP
jgi:hypothetical protein